MAKLGLPVSGFVCFLRAEYPGVFIVAPEDLGGAIVEIHGQMVPRPPT